MTQSNPHGVEYLHPVKSAMKIKQHKTPTNSSPGMCIANCHKQVSEQGGEVVTGWLRNSNRYFRCDVHHAVWRSPEGELLDITPFAELNGEHVGIYWLESVEFIPDPTAIFENQVCLPSKYVPVNPRHHRACKYLTQSDAAIQEQDFDRASYWEKKAMRVFTA